MAYRQSTGDISCEGRGMISLSCSEKTLVGLGLSCHAHEQSSNSCTVCYIQPSTPPILAPALIPSLRTRNPCPVVVDVSRPLGSLPSTTAAIVVDAKGHPAPEAPMSAEVDAAGRPYLATEKWQKMDAPGYGGREAAGLVDRIFTGLYGDLPVADRLRVAWLAGTLFFIIGG